MLWPSVTVLLVSCYDPIAENNPTSLLIPRSDSLITWLLLTFYYCWYFGESVARPLRRASRTKIVINIYIIAKCSNEVQLTTNLVSVHGADKMSSLRFVLQFCVELNQGTLASVRKWKWPRGLWKSVVCEKPTGQSSKVRQPPLTALTALFSCFVWRVNVHWMSWDSEPLHRRIYLWQPTQLPFRNIGIIRPRRPESVKPELLPQMLEINSLSRFISYIKISQSSKSNLSGFVQLREVVSLLSALTTGRHWAKFLFHSLLTAETASRWTLDVSSSWVSCVSVASVTDGGWNNNKGF